VRLFLRRHLLIRITPSADLETPAHPAERFRSLRARQGRAQSAAHSAPLCCWRSLGFYRFLRHLQDLRRDDRFGDRFLFHSCLHYKTDWALAAHSSGPIPVHYVPGIEWWMAAWAFLPCFHHPSSTVPTHYGIHRMRAHRTIGQVYSWSGTGRLVL